jgi:hypothetical protein
VRGDVPVTQFHQGAHHEGRRRVGARVQDLQGLLCRGLALAVQPDLTHADTVGEGVRPAGQWIGHQLLPQRVGVPRVLQAVGPGDAKQPVDGCGVASTAFARGNFRRAGPERARRNETSGPLVPFGQPAHGREAARIILAILLLRDLQCVVQLAFHAFELSGRLVAAHQGVQDLQLAGVEQPVGPPADRQRPPENLGRPGLLTL